MQPLPTKVDRSSEEYIANRSAMLDKITELETLMAQARAGGGPKYRARHTERGKMLVHEG
ncbi:MAG: hypothetical protein ACFCVC_21020 [Acidimicrobiia bacterium]